MDIELKALLKRAQERYDAMTPEEKAEMWKAQRESYVRGEMAMGDDADEEAYKKKLRDEGKL